MTIKLDDDSIINKSKTRLNFIRMNETELMEFCLFCSFPLFIMKEMLTTKSYNIMHKRIAQNELIHFNEIKIKMKNIRKIREIDENFKRMTMGEDLINSLLVVYKQNISIMKFYCLTLARTVCQIYLYFIVFFDKSFDRRHNTYFSVVILWKNFGRKTFASILPLQNE